MSDSQSIIVFAFTIVPLLLTIITVVVRTNNTTIFVSYAAIGTNAIIVNHTIDIAFRIRVIILANPIIAFRALEPAIVGYTTLPTTTIAALYFTHQTTSDLSKEIQEVNLSTLGTINGAVEAPISFTSSTCSPVIAIAFIAKICAAVFATTIEIVTGF